jgi:transposase-like protein
MRVFNDLKTRGVNDILIVVTDGLKGMPEVLAVVFPATTLQTCIVQLISVSGREILFGGNVRNANHLD